MNGLGERDGCVSRSSQAISSWIDLGRRSGGRTAARRSGRGAWLSASPLLRFRPQDHRFHVGCGGRGCGEACVVAWVSRPEHESRTSRRISIIVLCVGRGDAHRHEDATRFRDGETSDKNPLSTSTSGRSESVGIPCQYPSCEIREVSNIFNAPAKKNGSWGL